MFDLISGEWILRCFKRNGGGIVVFRALWVAFIFTLVSMLAVSLIDPCRVGPITWKSIHSCFWDLSDKCVIFLGSSYLAFYARFVSQWTYLAGLYNSIKQAESVPNSKKKVIAHWKAGYLEDAENLHLAAKNNIATIIRAWAEDELVKRAYIKNTLGGETRLSRLIKLAVATCDESDN